MSTAKPAYPLIDQLRHDLGWWFRDEQRIPSRAPLGWFSILRWAMRVRGFRAVFFYRLSRQAHLKRRKLRERFWSALAYYLCGAEIASSADIGPGLRLPHPQGVIISHAARIGAYVIIGQHATIGGSHGTTNAKGDAFPTIGDGAQINASSIIAGPITVGAGALIGALSLVTKDVPDNVLVGGIPAKVIKPLTEIPHGVQAARKLCGDSIIEPKVQTAAVSAPPVVEEVGTV